jgi:hypothetical protein
MAAVEPPPAGRLGPPFALEALHSLHAFSLSTGVLSTFKVSACIRNSSPKAYHHCMYRLSFSLCEECWGRLHTCTNIMWRR